MRKQRNGEIQLPLHPQGPVVRKYSAEPNMFPCTRRDEPSQAKDVLNADHLDVVADRGYFNSVEILACEQADITVTLPKPMTSGAKADGRFGKQDFAYLPMEDRRARSRPIVIQTKRAAGRCAIIGRRHARNARSSHSARMDLSGALSDGSTSTCATGTAASR
jgi:hypothetical protein